MMFTSKKEQTMKPSYERMHVLNFTPCLQLVSEKLGEISR